MIKVNELFAGIGAFRKALERLNIPHEIVGISEIDKYAIKSYEAMENNEQFRIRKLTPLECWRLMGFDDEDFRKAEAVNSNSQLYKQAGNSIVVNVLEGILRNLLLPVDPHKREAQDILKWLDEVMEVRD